MPAARVVALMATAHPHQTRGDHYMRLL